MSRLRPSHRPAHALRALALSALAAIAPAAPASTLAVAPERAFVLSEFWQAAATQRVDVVMIGDSNHTFAGYGWFRGWEAALHDRFGTYASTLTSGGGTFDRNAVQANGLLLNNAPPSIDLPFAKPPIPHSYVYVQPALPFDWKIVQGVNVGPSSRLNPNNPLRLRLILGTIADPRFGTLPTVIPPDGPIIPDPPPPPPRPIRAGIRATILPNKSAFLRPRVPTDALDATDPTPPMLSGTLRLQARAADFPYDEYSRHTLKFIATPTGGPVPITVDFPAAPRPRGLEVRWSPFLGPSSVGPFAIYWARFESPAVTRGVSLHTLHAQGGFSARDMAEQLINASDSFLTLFFSEVRALQPARKHILVRINTALNDRNETLRSLGPAAVLPGNSAAAYEDNIEAIVRRIRAIWTLNNWPQRELYFLITPSHPVPDPIEEAPLIDYRLAAQRVAARLGRTATIRLDRLTSPAELQARGWYHIDPWFGLDANHISTAGANAMTALEIDALRARSCRVDLDGDGIADIDDVLLFSSAHAAARPDADFDGSGIVTPEDFNAFFSTYSLGCP